VGDPFHERVDRDHRERRKTHENGEPVELQQDRQSDQRLQDEKNRRRADAHLPRRDRSRAGALDPGIEVAIDDVIPGAAGAAHGESTDEEQDAMPKIDALAGGNGGERNRPPAWDQEEPGTDRAIETRKPQIRARPGGSEAIDPVAGRISDRARALGHRANGLPVSVSKVPRGLLAVAEPGTAGVVPKASLRLGAAG